MRGPQPSSSTPPTLTCLGRTQQPKLRRPRECVSALGNQPQSGGRGAQTPVPRFLSEASAPLGASLRPAPETGNRKRREAAEQLLLPLDPRACDRRTPALYSFLWPLIGQQPSSLCPCPINPNHSGVAKISFSFSGRLSTNEARASLPWTLGGRPPLTRGSRAKCPRARGSLGVVVPRALLLL